MSARHFKTPKRFLRLADLQPQVDLAGCYRFPERIWFDCRNPTRGFKLIGAGVLEERTEHVEFTAGQGNHRVPADSNGRRCAHVCLAGG